jgi:hypothetical protein
MSSLIAEHTHPATAAVADLNAAIDPLSAASLWSMSRSEIAELVLEVEKVRRRLDAVSGVVLTQADVTGARTLLASKSTPVWLRAAADVPVWEGRARLALAHELSGRPAAADAFAAGALSRDAAAAICTALADLPAGVPAALVGDIETLLVQVGRDEGTRAVVRRAAQISHRYAPDLLEDNERRAHEHRFLALTSNHDGTMRVRGFFDAEAAALLTAALGSLSAPAPAVDGTPDPRDAGVRNADALLELCQRVTPSLPEVRGERPTVAVTISWETLQAHRAELRSRTGLGACDASAASAPGMFDTGAPTSVETVRRLLCDANVFPIVLGGRGEPLDIGRSSRVVPTGMRRALVARDQGCVFPGCDRPPSWCDAHHCVYWSKGGPTALSNLCLLCAHHHDAVHHDGWEISMINGLPWFIPPPTIDTRQRPRQHTRYQLCTLKL